MAGCQECACKFFMATLASSLLCLATRQFSPAFKDIAAITFQEYMVVSRHQPFCVVFRKNGIGSKLEKIVYDLWMDPETEANFTNWQFGSFNPNEAWIPAIIQVPAKLPAVRCYLGQFNTFDYSGRTDQQDVTDWLQQLENRYLEQNQEVTLELLALLKEQYDIILLAFPGEERHYEIEDLVYGIAEDVDSCKAVVVHHDSPHIEKLSTAYGVKRQPSVVVIHTKGGRSNEEEYRVFPNLGINQISLDLYLKAKSLHVPHMTVDLMSKYLHQQNTADWHFKPVLLLLYAKQAKDSLGHISAFNVTVNQYRSTDVNLRYGLIDLASSDTKLVVKKNLKMGALNKIPCTFLFYKDERGNITYSILTTDRPYPWVLFEKLEALGNGMLDLTNIDETVEPWITESEIQFTPLFEGPYGYQCSVLSHNMTHNTPYRLHKKKSNKGKKQPKKLSSIHHLFAQEKIEQRLARHEGIPLITRETWSEVIEKSHARGHLFYKAREWAGEVTKIALVVFIMADCGSCRNANETFHELSKSVTFIEGGAMYLVNCTAEQELCAMHDIKGFPIITTFRGLGWMGTSNCMSQKAQEKFKNYVRLDYHGVILAKPILEWFSNVAASAVIDMKFDSVTRNFNKNTRLVASLMPKHSQFLPLPPYRHKPYYFSYECLRLTCERLFGVIDCYSQYSDEIPQREFSSDDLEVIVTKIALERSDGVKANIMKFGNYLRQTLEEKTDDQLHRFHKPHRYNLGPNQKCEEDHAACTDLITDFVLDHSRLPITPITSDIFHTSSSLIQDEPLPILVALVYPENITEGSLFLQDLTSVAYDFYNKIIVMTLDASQYLWWASKFVPAGYGRSAMLDPDDTDPDSMLVYPRFCMVKKDDHKHAAFYPPLTRKRHQEEEFSRETVSEFVKDYLDNPKKLLEDTDQF